MDIETYLNLNPNIKIINQSSSSLLEHEKPIEEIEFLKSRGNFLLRQELEDKTPINTPNCIIVYHMILIMIFSIISIIILVTNKKKNFKEVEYTSCESDTCQKIFNISEDLKSPIYFYYKLDNFYSNHIDYVKSKNYNQLRGEEVSEKKIDSSCKYMSRNREHFKTNNLNEIVSYTSIAMDPDSIMNPCGLIANSIFNDTFKLFDEKDKQIYIWENGITLKIDKQKFFRNNKDSEKIQWYNKEDEHFINWMNMELFPNFIKKWGYIDQDLPKGEYKMIIKNNWGKTQWDIKKYFVLAKGNPLGSENFFGYMLIICSCLEVIFIFIICLTKYKKKKFNPEEMKWD